MLDSTSLEGDVTPGYAPGLSSYIGVGSFDEGGGGRYHDLLASGSELGRALADSWTLLQANACGDGENAPWRGCYLSLLRSSVAV